METKPTTTPVCCCHSTRISFRDARGNGRTAPVNYRCATHAREYRTAQFAKRKAEAEAALKARSMRLLLEAPEAGCHGERA
jgi:hypothetical protein